MVHHKKGKLGISSKSSNQEDHRTTRAYYVGYKKSCLHFSENQDGNQEDAHYWRPTKKHKLEAYIPCLLGHTENGLTWIFL